MKRRGLAHIEIILSFVIFIGFLLFAMYFFNPLSNKRVLDSSLFYAIDEVNKNISTQLEIYSVTINSVQQSVGIPLQNPNNLRTRVESYSGTSLPAEYTGGNVAFNRAGNDFVKIKLSSDYDLSSYTASWTPLSTSDFTISSSEQTEIASEKRALTLNESYYANYVELKKQFNIPNRVDFSFSLVFDSGEIIKSEREVPSGIDVVSDSKRIEIIRSNGESSFADLNVRVW